MRPFLKAILFLVILTLLEILLRKGLIANFIPIGLPMNATILLLFLAFALSAWLISKRFCTADKITLKNLGISLDKSNRFEFLYGFIIGVVLWGIVAICQSLLAGFSWEFRPDFMPATLLYGLLFIFIADLGTELYARGYPLTKLKESVGGKAAIIIMVCFFALKSFSFERQGELLFYSMLIPALHTVFFSIIYFKTKRLGASLGLHTGANFITISIFDLRVAQPNQAIPAGLFQANVELETLSLHALQLPWVLVAVLLSIITYLWWRKKDTHNALK